MQFRYYGEGNSKNYPSKLSKTKIINGSIFTNYLPIIRLKIKAPIETKFYLNQEKHTVEVDNEGKYELNLDNIAEINFLSFIANSFTNINEENPLIIDIVYERQLD